MTKSLKFQNRESRGHVNRAHNVLFVRGAVCEQKPKQNNNKNKTGKSDGPSEVPKQSEDKQKIQGNVPDFFKNKNKEDPKKQSGFEYAWPQEQEDNIPENWDDDLSSAEEEHPLDGNYKSLAR